jgi:hypothetical protein
MGQQHGHIVFVGTIGKLCFYKSCGEYCVRKASSLTGKRVKKDKAFARTMENAGILARASRTASAVYRELPKIFRQYWMYKAFTGEAIHLLRQGKTDEEARMILWKTYAEVWVNKEPASQSLVITDPLGATTGKKKTVQPVLLTSAELNDVISPSPGKYSKEDIASFVIPLFPSPQMVRRRRINRLDSLIA